jgi:hypothetical protein
MMSTSASLPSVVKPRFIEPVQESDCYRWRGGDEVNDWPVGKPKRTV